MRPPSYYPGTDGLQSCYKLVKAVKMCDICVMEGKKRLLLVDDEQDILDVLEYNFLGSGYDVVTARSAEEVLQRGVSDVDLMILDVMMSGMSGFKLAMQLKSHPETADIPIIFLTAKNAREDVIDGLRLGVDDYVTKPFSVQELILRVQAVLRRSRSTRSHAADVSCFGGMELNHTEKTLTLDSQPVSLTKTEYEILQILTKNPGRVFSRQQLLGLAWPEGVVVTDRSVDVGIARLRKKLGRYAPCIVTRPGFGYCFKYEEALP